MKKNYSPKKEQTFLASIMPKFPDAKNSQNMENTIKPYLNGIVIAELSEIENHIAHKRIFTVCFS